MVNSQNNTVTTKKVLESYIGEILESLQNHKDVWRRLQTNFFHQRQQLRSFVQSFKLSRWTFETFKNSGTKKKGVKCYNHMQSLATSPVVHHKWPKVSSLMKRNCFRWCVESFKWFRFNMVNCQNNTVTTQKVIESYIGEILESLQNHKDVWMLLQTNFFHQWQQLRSFVQSFKLFCWTFETFKNSGTKKKVRKC